MFTICLYINATLLEVLININIPFGRQNVRLEVHTQKAAPGSKDNYGFPPKLLKVSCRLQRSDLLVFYIFASNGGL